MLLEPMFGHKDSLWKLSIDSFSVHCSMMISAQRQLLIPVKTKQEAIDLKQHYLNYIYSGCEGAAVEVQYISAGTSSAVSVGSPRLLPGPLAVRSDLPPVPGAAGVSVRPG